MNMNMDSWTNAIRVTTLARPREPQFERSPVDQGNAQIGAKKQERMDNRLR